MHKFLDPTGLQLFVVFQVALMRTPAAVSCHQRLIPPAAEFFLSQVISCFEASICVALFNG